MGSEQFGRGNVWASAKEGTKWTHVPFNRSDYMISGTAFRISEEDIICNKYCIMGDIGIWQLNIEGDTEVLSLAGFGFLNIKSPIKVTDPTCQATVLGSMINPSSAQPCVVLFMPENLSGPPETHVRIGTMYPNSLNLGYFALAYTIIFGLR